MTDLSIIISIAGLFYAILSGVVGHIFTQLYKIKDSLNTANSVNDAQKVQIENNESQIKEFKTELKELRDKSDNKTEEIMAMISSQQNTLNNFITETRLHRERIEETLRMLSQK